MKKTFFVALLFLAACSNPLGSGKSKIDANYGPAIPPPAPTGFEAVSGAQLGQQTASATRIIDATVGSATGEIQMKTSRNRTVFLSVQGQMVSK